MSADVKLWVEVGVVIATLAAAFGALRAQLAGLARTLERVESAGRVADERLVKLEQRLTDADGRVALFWSKDWPTLISRLDAQDTKLDEMDRRLAHLERQITEVRTTVSARSRRAKE